MTDQEITTEVNTQPEKITATPSKRVKDPKKVAAGKALAAKNKERLEKLKKLERSTEQRDEPLEAPPIELNQSTNKTDQQYLWLAGGLLITLGAGYTIARLTSNQQSQPPPRQASPPAPKIKFVEDDF